jgi:hypothetical protein
MFADGMPQNWALFQIDLAPTNIHASMESMCNPIAVLSMEDDARALYNRLLDRYTGLTFVLTSHENGRDGYSEVG